MSGDMAREAGVLEELGLSVENPGAFCGRWIETNGPAIESVNPTTGKTLATVRGTQRRDYDLVTRVTVDAFREWRMVPSPKRGEVVRQLGLALRAHKEPLAKLLTLEVGKILSESLGEVQEMIDMADMAVGMSRQLWGNTMHSERPDHRMFEQWHPLGPIGIITAFNHPYAVWSWNAMVGAVCGNAMVWKPSDLAPLTGLAITRIAHEVLAANNAPPIFNMIAGDVNETGKRLVSDRRYPLISATGSVRMGREVASAVARRLGRTVLALGGNNGIVVMDDAEPDLAIRAVVFGAVGTGGQRCTTCRRLFLQRGIAPLIKRRLLRAYDAVRIGDPMDPKTLMGPVIDPSIIEQLDLALEGVVAEGGRLLRGGKALDRPGFFVEPAIVETDHYLPIAQDETLAPILYIFEFDTLDEAIARHNSVDYGLASAIFTHDLRATERFLSATGSDCGIANVNVSTSGNEIGGAFGGEKDSGGGREAGGDAWRSYMRRQTCTVNYGAALPLAQGVRFDVEIAPDDV